MALQLTNVLQDLFADLGIGQVHKVTATGTTTTTIDTALAGDSTDEGSIIVVTDAGGVAPEGEYGRITGFTPSSNTTAHDALTVATAAGDYVMLCRNDLPLFDAIEIVNRALKNLGDITTIDTTTLDTAANKTEYAAAVAWKRQRPTRVDIQTNTADTTDDNRWVKSSTWEYIPAAANSTGLIVFKSQPPYVRDIRVWYEAPHPRVATYSAYINESIPPELLRVAVLSEALSYLVATAGRGVDRELVERRNSASVDLSIAKSSLRVYRERRSPRYTAVHQQGSYTFTPNSVRLD